jgi:hypothetical protein
MYAWKKTIYTLEDSLATRKVGYALHPHRWPKIMQLEHTIVALWEWYEKHTQVLERVYADGVYRNSLYAYPYKTIEDFWSWQELLAYMRQSFANDSTQQNVNKERTAWKKTRNNLTLDQKIQDLLDHIADHQFVADGSIQTPRWRYMKNWLQTTTMFLDGKQGDCEEFGAV